MARSSSREVRIRVPFSLYSFLGGFPSQPKKKTVKTLAPSWKNLEMARASTRASLTFRAFPRRGAEHHVAQRLHKEPRGIAGGAAEMPREAQRCLPGGRSNFAWGFGTPGEGRLGAYLEIRKNKSFLWSFSFPKSGWARRKTMKGLEHAWMFRKNMPLKWGLDVQKQSHPSGI